MHCLKQNSVLWHMSFIPADIISCLQYRRVDTLAKSEICISSPLHPDIFNHQYIISDNYNPTKCKMKYFVIRNCEIFH